MRTIRALLFSSFRNLRAVPLLALTVVGLSAPSLRADTVQFSTELSNNNIRAGWTGSGFGFCANYYTTAAGRIGSLVNSYACSTAASSSTFQIVWSGGTSGSAKPAGGAYAVYNFCQAHETLKGATSLTVNIAYTNCGGNAASTTTFQHSGADDTWRRIGDLWLDGAMTAPTIKFTWASGGLSSSARWYSEQFKLIQVAGLYAVHIDAMPAASTTLCSGSSYTISVDAGTTTGPTYNWKKNGTATGQTGSAFSIGSVAAGDAGTYTCDVGGTYGGPVSSDNAVLYVNATPTAASAGGDQNVCGSLVATMAGNTPSVGSGSWSKVSGSGTVTFGSASSPTSTATASAYGTYVLRWTISNGVCTASTDDMTVNYYATPTTANAGTDQTQCETSTATLAGNTPTVGTGTWTRTGGSGTITTPSSPTSGVTGLGYGVNTFLWTIHNGTCSDSTDSMTITRYQNPTTANAGTDQTQCETSTATLAGNTPTVGTGTWTRTGGSGTITTPSSPTSGVTGLGYGVNTFLWTIHNGTCSDSTDSMTITRYANPTTANAGTDQTQCETSTATLAGNTPTVGSGAWTLVSGGGTITTPGSPASGVTGLGYGVNTFRWTISNGTCTASTSDVTITRHQTPTTANAGSAQTLCETTVAALAGNTPTVGSGAWTLVSGSGTITTPGSPASGVTGLGYGVNTLRWTISNGTCAPSSSDVTITRNQSPTITLGASPVVCLGSSSASQSYSATTGAPEQYSIVFDATAQSGGFTNVPWRALAASPIPVAVPVGASVGSYTGTVMVATSAGCSGGMEFTVTVAPVPAGGDASPTAAHVCSGSGTAITWTSGGNGGLQDWEKDEGSGWISMGTTANPLATGNLTQATRFRAVVTNGVCSSVNSSYGTVTVDLLPVAANNSYTRVQGLDFKIQISDLLSGGAMFQGVTSGTNGAVVSADSTYINYYPTNDSDDTLIYTVTNSAGCAASGSISLTVTPAPTAGCDLMADPNPSGLGTNVTFTAAFNGWPALSEKPTGDVVFLVGGVPFSTNSLMDGLATVSTASLPLGTNAIRAEYAGDGNFLGYTSSVAQVVQAFVPPGSQPNVIQAIVSNPDGSFTLTFQGTPGARYCVLASPDVTADMSTWTPLCGSTNTAPTSGQCSFIVSNAAPQYYRSMVINPGSP